MSQRARSRSSTALPQRGRLRKQRYHPHYVGNGNESLRLDQVITASPPEGGLAAYLRYLDESTGECDR
jgi:hypothetical protein